MLVLLLTFGALGYFLYRGDLGFLIKEWLHAHETRKEVNSTSSEEHHLNNLQVKSSDSGNLQAGEDRNSRRSTESAQRTSAASLPSVSSEVVQEEAQAARPSAPPAITDESVTPPDDKTGTLSVAPQVTDSKDGVLDEKNEKLPEESGTRDIATKEPSNFPRC